MSDTNDKGMELFLTGLRNQHGVENQAVSLLSRQGEFQGWNTRSLSGNEALGGYCVRLWG